MQKWWRKVKQPVPVSHSVDFVLAFPCVYRN